MKKDTGMSRKVDELGRIVIPKEIRDKFDIRTNDKIHRYFCWKQCNKFDKR